MFRRRRPGGIHHHLYVELPKELCELSGWTRKTSATSKDSSGQEITNINVTRPGPNMAIQKIDKDWSTQRGYDTESSLEEFYEIPWVDRSNPVTHRFLMSDIAWTFFHVNRSFGRPRKKNRSLYVYSSLIDPVLMGDQTADLLCQIPFEELEKGTYYFDPSQIQYIELRNNQFQVVETQLSDTLTNELADISKEGASILTLHFKKVR